MNRSRMLTCVVALAVLPGCGPAGGDGDTVGDMGRVHFRYKRSCFFGCPLEQPLLAGTRETIGLTGRGNDEGIVVASSDPDVAIFALERECFCERRDDTNVRVEVAKDADCAEAFRKACENTVQVQAMAAGDVKLTLLSDEGASVDSATILVRKAERNLFIATFDDRVGAMDTSKLDMKVDETVGVEVELYDADGRKLLAPEAVTWRIDDDKVATVSAFLQSPRAELQTGLSVSVQAVAAGTTSLTVDVPGSDAKLALRVR